MEVKLRQGVDKVRTMYRIWGFGPDIKWGIHNNNLTNFLRGLVERVYLVQSRAWQGLVPTPRPEARAFDIRLAEFRRRLRRWLPRAAPVDANTFVEYYRGRKRSIYAKAAASLIGTPLRAVDAYVKSFVKAEKVNLSKKPDPAPRLIQPRDPRYNVEVGRFLRPLEKVVYRAIAKVWGGPTVLKVNAAQQGSALRDMWEQFKHPVAVGLDASRFDQHVSRDALRWEHSVYLACFDGQERERLAQLLQWQLHNVGRAYLPTAAVKYRVEGCRMSGDINTSLGNCLLMCAMVWAYCEERGIRARLANNGDDCIVVMEEEDLARFSLGLEDWFLSLGFEMEVEAPVRVFEEIVFCQTQPVWHPTGWTMVRDPRIAVSKDLVSLLNLEQALAAYYRAIGDCGLSAYGGMPVFQELYMQLKQAGKATRLGEQSGVGEGFRRLAEGMNRSYGPIHPMTRASFCFAFGITPDEQVSLENWLRDCPIDPAPRHTLTGIVPKWFV